MALSDLNLLSQSQYFSLLYDMIKQRENPWLYAGTGFQRIHDGGGDGNPTFGYGFNLAAFSANIVEAVILHAYSGALTGQQNAGLDIILDWKTGTPVLVNGQGMTLTNAHIINMADITLNGAPGAFGSPAQRDAVQSLFLNDVQATRMLDVMIKGDLNLVHIEGPPGSYGYEDGLDYRLTEEGGMALSTERAALLSVYYNAPSLIGPGVQNAVMMDDRPQLWYEIRYNHNHYDLRGLQNRRADESNLLGLVSQPAKDDPQAHLAEYAAAADTIFNGFDRLGRQIYTQILDRDIYDPFPQAIAAEMDVLNQYFARAPLGDPLAPTIDFVQFDSAGADSIIDGADAAAAGVIGGKDQSNTVNLILGEDGDDLIRGFGARDYLYGGGDQDTIYGGDGGDYIDGGNGADRLLGENDADTILGGAGADSVEGGAGDDVIRGGGDNDTLRGGDQHDRIEGDAGRDLIFGDDGHDILSGFGSHDSLYGGNGNDDLRGGYGRDLLNGSGGDDILRGYEGDDRLFGGANNDVLFGNDGDDSLTGGGGADRLKGDAGNDTLNGRFGADTVSGGAGDDLFEFRQGHGADIIDDFTAGAGSEDVIKLIAFGAAFDSFVEVLAASTQVGADVVIDFGGGDSITLLNVALASLYPDDLTFA